MTKLVSLGLDELQQESKAANAPVRDKVQSNDRYISAQHTSEEIEELVLSDTTQSNVPFNKCPECGKILWFKSGHLVCLHCGYSK